MIINIHYIYDGYLHTMPILAVKNTIHLWVFGIVNNNLYISVSTMIYVVNYLSNIIIRYKNISSG